MWLDQGGHGSQPGAMDAYGRHAQDRCGSGRSTAGTPRQAWRVLVSEGQVQARSREHGL